LSVQQSLEAAVIAKVFPNVFVGLCWGHVIAPSASRRALHEFLGTVPSIKIFGNGGNYWFPELSYAHSQMVCRNVSPVLTHQVSEGSCSEEEALEVGRKLLHDDPDALFGDSSGWRKVASNVP